MNAVNHQLGLRRVKMNELYIITFCWLLSGFVTMYTISDNFSVSPMWKVIGILGGVLTFIFGAVYCFFVWMFDDGGY